MGAVDLDSGEERDSEEVEESSPEEQDPPPPSPSSQFACSVAGKSHTEDPLSHYQSPTGMATVRCGNCKLQGHKWTSYSQPLRADLVIRKNNHKSTRSMPEEASSAPGPSAASAPSAPGPSAAARAAPSAPSRPGPSHAPGMMGYFTAGANASAGRDASVLPLATSRNYGAPGPTDEAF
ncbi:hypothetical protein ACQ4PT_009647 [Festuca glaucescens]